MATGASNCRSRHRAGRRAQGRAAQTRRHAIICSLLGIRHVVLAVNKIDLVGFDQRRLRRASSRTSRPSPTALGFATIVADPDLGALRRQCHRRGQRAHALVSRARRCSSISRPSRSTTIARPALPLPGAMGQPAESRFPRLCRHGRERHASPSATRSSWSPLRPRQRASHAFVTADGDLDAARSRRRGDAHARRRDRRRARRHAGRRPPAGPRSPTSSPRTSSG